MIFMQIAFNMKQYRCTFTNDFHRVGQRISEFEYNNLPYSIQWDYKEVFENGTKTLQTH